MTVQKEQLLSHASQLLISLREQKPIIHNVTNFVVMQQTANALLALGASPIMAHAPDELEDIAQFSGSLVVNMGTLDDRWVDSMKRAMAVARAHHKPIIFDPVGAGATRYRSHIAELLLNATSPAVIRGNASEIMSLAGIESHNQGVDSSDSSDKAIKAAKQLSVQYNTIVVVSGAIDWIVGHSMQSLMGVENGVPMMARVTGMGCTATAIIGAFCAMTNNAFEAAVAGMLTMGIVGDMAASKTDGPGSFQVSLCDALYSITPQDLQRRARLCSFEKMDTPELIES